MKGGDGSALQHKIMFVEDEQMILDMLREHFESEGYIVYTALSAEMAMKKLSSSAGYRAAGRQFAVNGRDDLLQS